MAWITSVGAPGDSPFMAAQVINRRVRDAHAALYEALVEAESPLTIAERRAIAVTVSAINRSPYWLAEHAQLLRAEQPDPDLPDKLSTHATGEGVPDRTRALCNFAEKLTIDPGGATQDDIAQLREAGLDDREIHDACQITAYFNYANRIANGLGVLPLLPSGYRV